MKTTTDAITRPHWVLLLQVLGEAISPRPSSVMQAHTARFLECGEATIHKKHGHYFCAHDQRKKSKTACGLKQKVS